MLSPQLVVDAVRIGRYISAFPAFGSLFDHVQTSEAALTRGGTGERRQIGSFFFFFFQQRTGRVRGVTCKFAEPAS